MLIFAADTSCTAASAAILKDGKLLCEWLLNQNRTHSQKFMPMVENMLKQAGVCPEELDMFAAGIGPGSFTGIRIGVTAVKAMAYAAERPAVGVTTLQALAAEVGLFCGWICPIMDARNRQVYTSAYTSNGGGLLTEVIPPAGLHIDVLLEQLAKAVPDTFNVLFTGDGVDVYSDEIQHALGERAFFAPQTQRISRAGTIARLAAARYAEAQSNGEDMQQFDSFLLEPFYLRESQAERLHSK